MVKVNVIISSSIYLIKEIHMSVTIQDITRTTAANLGLTQAAVREIIMEAFEVIGANLSEGNSVVLKGLGRFNTKVRPARICRVPNSGEQVNVPPKRVVKFVPRGDLKASLNDPSWDGASEVQAEAA